MINTQVCTQDNTSIAISKYQISHPKAVIVVGSATGVPRRFYRHFADAANKQNFEVLTLDYRGIGDSAPAKLKGYMVDYLDWAKQDLAAVIDEAKKSGLPVFLVGHSYGGQALGLLPNIDLIAGAYVFGAGAGWSGWMPPLERLKVNLMWNVFAPILVKVKGYMAWSKLGMGEDLPYGVYKQWKHWCQFPRYFFDDPAMAGIEDVYARYKGSLVAANATDDKWAQPASRDAFMVEYKNAELTTFDLKPEAFGLKSINHMGYFLKQAAPLWKAVFTNFDIILVGSNTNMEEGTRI